MSIRTTFASVLTILLLVSCGSSTPSKDDVHDLVEQFLIHSRDCSDERLVEHLEITEIGDFDKQFKAWPVIADFKVTCIEENSETSWTSGENSNAAVAYVRKGKNGYKLFAPKLFQDGFQQFDAMMENAMEQMADDLESQ